jgi:hypothetical protein
LSPRPESTTRARRSFAVAQLHLAAPCRTPSPPHLSQPRHLGWLCRRTRHLPVQSALEIRFPSSKLRHTGEFAGVRRRSPPSAVARRRLRTHVHSQPLDRDRATLINLPQLFKSAPPAAVGSRSNGSDRASPGHTGQNGMTSRFCRKPPELFGFHKNTLPQW